MKHSIDWSRLLNKLYKLESKLLQKVENRIEEVVITVFEKKRLNPKLKPFRKKLTRRKFLRNITIFHQAFVYGVYLKT